LQSAQLGFLEPQSQLMSKLLVSKTKCKANSYETNIVLITGCARQSGGDPSYFGDRVFNCSIATSWM
jgi:hypothetical protein